MSFVYLPTCCACSVAETKEQEAKAGHRPCSPCSPGFTPAAKRLPSARRPGTARRRGTGRQEGGCGRSSGAQGSVPAVRHAAMARPRPKQNRPRDGRGAQHLPAPAPPAAALPSPGAGGAPAGEPRRGSAGQRPRETTPPPPASPSHPLRDGARPRRAGCRGRYRWGRSAARGPLGGVVPPGGRRRGGAAARTTSPRAAGAPGL